MFVEGDVCRLGGYENTLLGYKTRSYKVCKEHMEDIDLILFGMYVCSNNISAVFGMCYSVWYVCNSTYVILALTSGTSIYNFCSLHLHFQ